MVSPHSKQRSPIRSPIRGPRKTIGGNNFHLDNSPPASPCWKRINPKSSSSIVEGSSAKSSEASDETDRQRRSSSMSLDEKLKMLNRSLED